jgi:hypothetical protein
MTGTNCDLFTHKSSRLYLNHLEPSGIGMEGLRYSAGSPNEDCG